MTDAPAGEQAVLRGVQGPKGMFSARIGLGLNLSADAVGKPFSIAPDLFYAVSDKLQFGLLHMGPLGWQSRPGTGLCLTGTDNGCPKVYNNLGLDLMYGVLFGKTHLSARGTLFFTSLDPVLTHLAVGVTGKSRFNDKAALVYDPKILIALNDRDTSADVLAIPLELEYQFGEKTVGKLLTGLSGNLDAFGDTYQIPVGVGVMRNLTEHVDLGGRFSFDNLLGNQPEGVGRADIRSLMVLLALRS